MSTEAVAAKAAQLVVRRGIARIPDDWRGCDAIWPALEAMADAGCSVVIKIDGERTGPEDTGRYTVVVSGGPLGKNFFRIDTPVLEEGLAKAILHFAEVVWS
jgi:hypothetical protein